MRADPILITGGEGFIGAHLAKHLEDTGAEVHVISRPTSHRPWRLLEAFGASVRFCGVDLLDRQRLRETMAFVRPKVVFHLAGRVNLDRSAAEARRCITENIAGTVNLLESLSETPLASLIYTSTTEVYGRNPIPFQEDQPVDPPSPYAISKVAAEHFCRLYAITHGYPVRILRMASAYGPGQPLSRLIPSTILAILRGEPVRLQSPKHRRDFIYVRDLVEGIALAAAASIAPEEILNLGSDESISVQDLVERILFLMGSPRIMVEVRGAGRPNEADHWATSAAKAQSWLGWTPKTSLDEGLTTTIAWYANLFKNKILS